MSFNILKATTKKFGKNLHYLVKFVSFQGEKYPDIQKVHLTLQKSNRIPRYLKISTSNSKWVTFPDDYREIILARFT